VDQPRCSQRVLATRDDRLLRIKMDSALNLVYDEWPNFLGNRPMVEALLSRLRHYCHTVHIDGPSLRPPQS
jgi:DNA replication protein DnaC